MKKLVLLFAIVFTMSPLLNAAEAASRVCHSIAQAIADDSGYEGVDYAVTYLSTYDDCEATIHIEEEEEIADGY